MVWRFAVGRLGAVSNAFSANRTARRSENLSSIRFNNPRNIAEFLSIGTFIGLPTFTRGIKGFAHVSFLPLIFAIHRACRIDGARFHPPFPIRRPVRSALNSSYNRVDSLRELSHKLHGIIISQTSLDYFIPFTNLRFSPITFIQIASRNFIVRFRKWSVERRYVERNSLCSLRKYLSGDLVFLRSG